MPDKPNAYIDPHERHIDRIGRELGTPQPRLSDDYRMVWRSAQSFGPEYDPEPPKASAPKHLRRIAPGHYESPDGRYEVAYDFYWLEGECECAVCQGFIAADCPNDGCGKREGWHIWDREANNGRGDYAIFAHEPQAFQTFSEARSALLQAYEAGEA